MALQFSRTDSDTGYIYTVYARIDDALMALASGTGSITLNLYASAETAALGLKPVLDPDKIILTSDEAGALRTEGLALFYALLKARPAYSAAEDV